MSTTPQTTSLAYEQHGAGVPVVLIPGLTFERSSWRPIIDRLGGRVRSIAVDLPGQCESAGPACALEALAAQVPGLVDLGSEPPVVVGHSMSGAVAMIYAATYPTRAAVDVDLSFD